MYVNTASRVGGSGVGSRALGLQQARRVLRKDPQT